MPFATRLALMTLVACGTAMAVAQLILGNPREFHVTPPASAGDLDVSAVCRAWACCLAPSAWPITGWS